MAPRQASEEVQTRTRVTGLLQAANQGDDEALERLVALLYDELRWLAHRQLYRNYEKSFSTTELVNEAYLKLVRGGALPDQNKSHFLGSAARAMRQVLVTEARRRHADKRSPDGPQVPLEMVTVRGDPVDVILSVHGALEVLAEIDQRLVRVVECRFFAGLSEQETADVVGASARTVRRDWRKARAWLYERLGGASAEALEPAAQPEM